MSRLCIAVVMVLFASVALGEAPALKPISAQTLRARNGLGHVLEKLRNGDKVRIAYLGGSITAAPGWRVKSLAWFKEQFPEAEIEEIHAAIGGTGSDLGVHRLGHDVLRHKPDLLFVEFAVNDGGAQPERIWRAMEGIVRQTWAADPETDICFVYTVSKPQLPAYESGECFRSAASMEMLADHYGIPSVNFAVRVVEQMKAGKLIFQAEKGDKPGDGQIIFSHDGVHPIDAGHELYTQVLTESIQKMADLKPVDHAAKLAGEPFLADHWQAAKMVAIEPGMLSGSWQKLSEDNRFVRRFGKRMPVMFEGTKPGDRISFRFRGSSARLYDLLGPDGGQLIITVDGETRGPVPRFDRYCTYHRIGTVTLATGLDPQKVHTVTVEIHPEQPDRSPVTDRLEKFDPKTYDGHAVRLGGILMIGELVE